MTFLNAPVPRRTDTSSTDRIRSDAAGFPQISDNAEQHVVRSLPKRQPAPPFGRRTTISSEARDFPDAPHDEPPFERGSLARMSPRQRYEARRLARARAGAGLPSGPRLFLPPRLILNGALASIRHTTRDIRHDAAYMLGRLPADPVVSGLENLPVQRPYVLLSNHYERRPGAWVGWCACIIVDAVARARPGAYPIRWVMTSAWEDCHIGPWYIDPRHLRWALQRFADLYGIILTPADDRRAFGRGAALRDIFHALANPSGEVVALHPEAGGTQSLITPPRGMGRFLTMLDRRGVTLVPVGAYEDGRRFHVTFGPALIHGALDGLSDVQSAGRVMRAIAELLPVRSRGVYANTAIRVP
jgi:hypothetical protein